MKETTAEKREHIEWLINHMEEDPKGDWMLSVLCVVCNRLLCYSGKSKLFSFNLL